MLYFYDLEVWQNFFSALLMSEDGEDEYVFIKHFAEKGDVEERDDLSAFVSFLNAQKERLTLVSYNGITFDEVLLRGLLQKPDITNRQIHTVSQAIINRDKRNGVRGKSQITPGLKALIYEESPWNVLDLMQLLEVNSNRPSLKHVSIHLEHDRLEDLPIAFDAKIKGTDISKIITYNRNDVSILRKLYSHKAIQEALVLRERLGQRYSVNLMSAGDSKLANVVFESEYGKPDIQGTPRPIVYGKDLVPPTLRFLTPELRDVQRILENVVLVEDDEDGKHYLGHEVEGYRHSDIDFDDDSDIYETKGKDGKKKKFNHLFTFNGTEFTIGQGGLHSVDKPRIIVPEGDMILRDADGTSFYPFLIINYGLVPEHLDKKRYLSMFNRLIDERIKGKVTGDIAARDGLKIAINAAFGKMNFRHFWLYDPLAFFRVTLYGQLLLLDLVEKLHLVGVDCISANTDGIVCYFDKSKEEDYFRVCREWQERTMVILEYTDYEKMVQLNVNSYLSITKQMIVHDGDKLKIKAERKIKKKKDFDDNKNLQKGTFVKGYNAPVIALALHAYFVEGIKPDTFIKQHTNVHNFFYTQRAGQKFTLYFVEPGKKETKLQKTNRYFVANSGGYLYKRDVTPVKQIGAIKGSFATNKQTAILKGQFVQVWNDIPENVQPDINYDFYIGKVQEIIDKIERREDNKPIPLF